MAFYEGYTGAGACTQGPQTGARGFMSWFLAKFSKIGGQNSGIYNCRPVRGSSYVPSIHGEGRAVDLGLKIARNEFAQLADLLRTHSAELGIQCIIYKRKIWSGGYESNGWQTYGGVNPHTDHLHVEMAWWSARMSAKDYIALLEKTIGNKIGAKYVPTTSAPSKAPAGGSIVDYLNSKGINSSFNNRSKLAAQNGISGYKGSAAQNTQLLEKLKAGKTSSPSKPAPAKPKPVQSGYKGDSIVAYLNSVGKNSSFSARATLASNYGIGGYRGTASQNLSLLSKLRGVSKPAAKKKVTGSVVDYLNSKGRNSSFGARKQLAAKHGIKNYTGTASQNTTLLSKLQD